MQTQSAKLIEAALGSGAQVFPSSAFIRGSTYVRDPSVGAWDELPVQRPSFSPPEGLEQHEKAASPGSTGKTAIKNDQ